MHKPTVLNYDLFVNVLVAFNGVLYISFCIVLTMHKEMADVFLVVCN